MHRQDERGDAILWTDDWKRYGALLGQVRRAESPWARSVADSVAAVVMSAAVSKARPEYAAFLVQRYLPMDRSTDIPGPRIRTILTPVLIFL